MPTVHSKITNKQIIKHSKQKPLYVSSSITSVFIMTVECFINREYSRIIIFPEDIKQLIILYGKAIVFNIKYNQISNHICVCPATNTWYDMTQKIMDEYELDNTKIGILRLQSIYGTVDKESWSNYISSSIDIFEPITYVREKIILTCNSLKQYYNNFGIEYVSIFSRWCEENEFDDDAVEEEFDAYESDYPQDWMLAEFDENDIFPFNDKPNNDTDKYRGIYHLMTRFWNNCHNQNATFNFGNQKYITQNFDTKYFEIKEEDIDKIKQIYADQCPALFNSGMATDGSFLKLLAIGYKNDFNYIQCLVDDYFRDRIGHLNEPTIWQIDDWQRKHKHFQKIKDIPFSTPQSTSKEPKTVGELILAAIESYGKIVCPMLQFQPMRKINDSLDHVTKYIQSGFLFITNVFNQASALKPKRAICPFQFDMCIVSNKPKSAQVSVSASTNDDDDENDIKLPDDTFVDCVGDIEKKLKVNKLKYRTLTVPVKEANFGQGRVFLKLFNEFEDKHQHSKIHDKYYLHKKRLISLVDRRDCSKDDDEKNMGDMNKVYLYEPPSNCSSIPKDAVNEWFISSSKTCLLPNVEYGNGKHAVEVVKENLINSNIESSFHCKGALLTISFHVKSMEEIKIYLYWNGQITRFMPNDIKILFPILFDMNEYGNKQFINSKEIDMRINEMNKIIMTQGDDHPNPMDLKTVTDFSVTAIVWQ